MFADSDRGHHAPPPFATHQRWAQAHPGYFQTDSGQYTFDMKWWAQQKQSMDAYLSVLVGEMTIKIPILILAFHSGHLAHV